MGQLLVDRGKVLVRQVGGSDTPVVARSGDEGGRAVSRGAFRPTHGVDSIMAHTSAYERTGRARYYRAFWLKRV